MDAQLVAYVRWRDSLPDLSSLAPDEAWEAFRAAHEDRCAICRQPPKATAKRAAKLVIDHCHVTGWVRGLLCRGCNRRADSGRRNIPLSNEWSLPAVTAYCQLPPADVAGLRRMYEGAFWADPCEELRRAIWHAGPGGAERGYELIGRELVEHMRRRFD
jgi:hypothetical protein